MGLFVDVISHYKPLGDEFTGVALQTKSLDCCMSTYWISPAGELFMEDWGNSMTMVDKEVSPTSNCKFNFPWKWVPTGEHKKLSPVYYTGAILVYPAKPSCLETWPEATLLLKLGKVIYHEITNKNFK